MSMDVALTSAVSALLVIEKEIGVASNNIANADVAGYTEESVDVATQVSGGIGTGITDLGTTTTIDQNLVKEIVSASSDAGYADTVSSYFQILDEYMGELTSSGSTNTLSSEISTLASDLSNLAETPTSGTYKAEVVSDLDTLTATLRGTSDEVQTLREDADSEIGSTVSEINGYLSTISDLNAEIRQASIDGQSTAALEDQRATALEDLSSDMGISYFTDSQGNVQVYTSSGQVLVDDSTVHYLSYTPASSVSSQTTYPDGGLSGITVDGVDITDSLQTGTLGGLVDLRDTALTEVQSELDNLASSLSDTLNAIYNEGSSDPPESTLTGTTSVTASEAFSATGTVRVAVVDSSGDIVTYDDIDLSTLGSISSVLTALNDVSGVTASLDAEGHLVIASTDADDGVAINEMTSSVGTADAGFSDYFGLNDLLVDGDSASTIAVRSDLLSSSSSLATGMLDGSSTLTAGSAAIDSDTGTIATLLYDALSEEQSFAAAGNLGATTASFADYGGDIISSVATTASSASAAATTKDTALSTLQTSYSNETGVNTDTETAKLEQLQNDYAAAAKVVSVVESMFQTLLDAVAA